MGTGLRLVGSNLIHRRRSGLSNGRRFHWCNLVYRDAQHDAFVGAGIFDNLGGRDAQYGQSWFVVGVADFLRCAGPIPLLDPPIEIQDCVSFTKVDVKVMPRLQIVH